MLCKLEYRQFKNIMNLSSLSLFPYPVLKEPGNTDYGEHSFVFAVHKEDLTYSCQVTHPELENLIKEEKLNLLLSISSPHTYFHEFLPIQLGDDMPLKPIFSPIQLLVHGKLEIIPLIVSTNDFKKPVKLSSIHKEFGFNQFNIKKNQILGISTKLYITIENENTVNPKSILTYVINEELEDGEILLLYNDENLKVQTSRNTYLKIMSWKSTDKGKETFFNGFLLPIVMQALEFMRSCRPNNEENSYHEYRWYMAIQDTLKELDIDPEEIYEPAFSILDTANQILKYPFTLINEDHW